MTTYEARRQENIRRNQALIAELGIERKRESTNPSRQPSKKRKLTTTDSIATRPTRISARIASAPQRPTYNEDEKVPPSSNIRQPARRKIKTDSVPIGTSPQPSASPPPDLETIKAHWTDWKPSAPPPTRDVSTTFHFESHPVFQPNKSPAEMLSEGVFGGSYYRPLYSRALRTTVSDDWRELPTSWLSSMTSSSTSINSSDSISSDDKGISRYLINTEYDPEVNKYGVKCGQTIEEWEAAGWIAHDFDVRGWFQWYTRFFMGRRCEDDERQVGRWARCVGDKGRWRRTLVKKYLARGVRNVADEGGDEEEVSPVLHQTCLHWAWELRQDALDRAWEE